MSSESFAYLPFFDIYKKYQDIDDVLEILHYAKISDTEPPEEILNQCVKVISEFVEQWNKQYSEISGIKFNINITSRKWNHILSSNKSHYFPTIMGFGEQI